MERAARDGAAVESANMDPIALGRTSRHPSTSSTPASAIPGLLGCWVLHGGSLLTLGLLTLACVRPVDGATLTDNHTVNAPEEPVDAKRDLAVTRARETLRNMGIDPSSLTVRDAQPVTWPDSSLGCPQPGTQYLQVVTPGYQVEFQGAQGSYRVHVAGNRAIVCTGGTGSTGSTGAATRLARPLVPVRGIDVMTQRAKEMLAAGVHAPADQIHVAGLEPQAWPDTGLGCPSSAQAVPGRVSGYRIKLEHQGREYTFNTDLHRVIACPAIDPE